MKIAKVRTATQLFRYVEKLGYNSSESAKDNFKDFLNDNSDLLFSICDWIEENYPEEDHSVDFEGEV